MNRITPLFSLVILALLVTLEFGAARADEEPAWPNQPLTISGPLASAVENSSADMMANCRYGVTAGEGHVDLIPKLGTGVFYKFNYPQWVGPLPQNQAEQIHMIRVTQKKSSSGAYLPGYKTSIPLDSEFAGFVRKNTGKLWLVGNEMERGPDPGKTETRQGDIYPKEYVVAYHDLYKFIKANDPTARVAIGGMIQPTPMRLQYLDIVWDTYLAKYGEPIPVDVWNIHLYPLSEAKSDGSPNNIANIALGTDPTLAKRMPKSAAECPNPDVYCIAEHGDISLISQHLITFRQWMKDHGQQQKPLIISEHGIVFPIWTPDEYGNAYTWSRVGTILQETFDYFSQASSPSLGYALDNDRLVQQVVWFDAYTHPGFASNLAGDYTGDTLSRTGEVYRDYIASETPQVNLIAERVAPTKITTNSQGNYDITLTMTFRNNGNTAVAGPFQVTFYKDSGLTQALGSATIKPLVRGCAMQSYEATVLWQNATEGSYQVWAKVDSQNAISETQESDNTISANFAVNGSAVFYTLDVQSISEGEGEGGTVEMLPKLDAYPAGTQVELTAVAYVGWSFAGWSGGLTGTNPEATLVMNSDKQVQAHFSRDAYTVKTKVVGEGQIELNPTKQTYTYGEWVTLKAIPAQEWRFAAWSGSIEGNNAVTYLRMEENASVTATFDPAAGEVFAPVTMGNP